MAVAFKNKSLCYICGNACLLSREGVCSLEVSVASLTGHHKIGWTNEDIPLPPIYFPFASHQCHFLTLWCANKEHWEQKNKIQCFKRGGNSGYDFSEVGSCGLVALPNMYQRHRETLTCGHTEVPWVDAFPDASTPPHLLPHCWTHPVHCQWMGTHLLQWGGCDWWNREKIGLLV